MRHSYLVTALLVAATAVACGGNGDEGSTATTTSTSTSTTSPEASSTSPTVELPPLTLAIDGCVEAPLELIDHVESSLSGRASQASLRLAFVVEAEGVTFFGASIYEADGNRLSSGDIWVIDGETTYAVSGSANEYTSFPDGRPRWSAGGEVADGMIDDCLFPAIRAANQL